ncbi:MAG: Diaminopimelate decarboxylase [uncultured Sphingomonadaceae bacterium]|uniref:Diaminopimelate decarboxylase n=1 Tax=uncultured Sphingomonadaceae bacterium TaxID=169976 RepID=A0A6J4TEQ3_9SPHN|nr:MAG: Diaminopimelate decarboxylase [uncultured Sphingomonadaceae bacterium]
MKSLGPIPNGFGLIDGELAIAGVKASDHVRAAGDTPLFLYDFGLVRARVARFRAAMPADVHLHYAVKANPFPGLVRALARLVDGLDAASLGECRLIAASGGDPARASFAGPAKRDDELAGAIAMGVAINLESESEADRALAAADRLSVRPRLAVRVNPPFEIKGSGMRMGGGAKPFGVDAERAGALARRVIAAGAEWRGWHVFAGSQALAAGAVADAQAAAVALAGELSDEAGAAPPLVNLGGGFGIPYSANDRPLDVEAIGARLGEALAARASGLADSRFALELGRWLVGEAGVYLTRIVDRKESRGKLFLACDGGLHHQLAATGNLGQVVRRNYPVAIATRMGSPAEEVASIVGPLCTPLDRLADEVAVPAAHPGDLVAVFLAGAYGLTASPQAFLSQRPAIERLLVPD